MPGGICAAVRWARAVTLILTTAGPYCATMPEKSVGVATAAAGCTGATAGAGAAYPGVMTSFCR
ncbi:hypothetical protein D3C85_1635780 [compost metagenome]